MHSTHAKLTSLECACRADRPVVYKRYAVKRVGGDWFKIATLMFWRFFAYVVLNVQQRQYKPKRFFDMRNDKIKYVYDLEKLASSFMFHRYYCTCILFILNVGFRYELLLNELICLQNRTGFEKNAKRWMWISWLLWNAVILPKCKKTVYWD